MKKRIRITNILKQARDNIILNDSDLLHTSKNMYLCNAVKLSPYHGIAERLSVHNAIQEIIYEWFSPRDRSKPVIWTYEDSDTFNGRQFQRTIALELLINIYKDKKITIECLFDE